MAYALARDTTNRKVWTVLGAVTSATLMAMVAMIGSRHWLQALLMGAGA